MGLFGGSGIVRIEDYYDDNFDYSLKLEGGRYHGNQFKMKLSTFPYFMKDYANKIRLPEKALEDMFRRHPETGVDYNKLEKEIEKKGFNWRRNTGTIDIIPHGGEDVTIRISDTIFNKIKATIKITTFFDLIYECLHRYRGITEIEVSDRNLTKFLDDYQKYRV